MRLTLYHTGAGWWSSGPRLGHYGVNGKVGAWIAGFLQNMSQQVVVDEASSWASVESGGPQCTVLGPLLFSLFINDLPAHVTSQVRLFVDDCLLYHTIKSAEDHMTLQQDLKQLGLWVSTWGMWFNPSKCVIMTITRVERKRLHKLYMMEGVVLLHVQEAKCLGILISDDLSWTKHTQRVSSKAKKCHRIAS